VLIGIQNQKPIVTRNTILPPTQKPIDTHDRVEESRHGGRAQARSSQQETIPWPPADETSPRFGNGKAAPPTSRYGIEEEHPVLMQGI
jgi:hypothetical protein